MRIPIGGLVGLAQTRQLSVVSGILLLLLLGVMPDGILADRLAVVALVAFGLGAVLGWAQLIAQGPVIRGETVESERQSRRSWSLVVLGVAAGGALAIQSWFKAGTSIGTGDITPPDGTAWLSRLVEPWAWTGSNLGEPSQLQLNMPWAAILAAVHGLGGDPGTAQRIWYTILFVGAGLGAVGLMRALRIGPVGATIGAGVYLLNPYVTSVVVTYPNYIAALGLLAGMPAVLIAVGHRDLSVRWGAVILAVLSPLLGYTFLNPPLVGMVLAVMLATPLLLVWLDGRDSGLRSFQAVALSVPLMLAVSFYWIVPAFIHLVGLGAGQLSTLSSWTWTEGRATVRNAFWLNTSWGWIHPEYFPYAGAYDAMPLKVLRFVLPAVAFATLALRAQGDMAAQVGRGRSFELALPLASVALLVILVSTGTNQPGNTLFRLLYGLPFGWLLREPGRFLMLVGLGYAVLIALIVDNIVGRMRVRNLLAWGPDSVAAARPTLVPAVVVVAILLVGFPVYTGAVVPDARPLLPPAHIHVPAYWPQMAKVVDELPTRGAVLIMPPDDFYQMSYSWGYYGNEAFIVDMFRRPVLIPNQQSYISTSPEVLDAVNMTAQSLLRHDWHQAEILARTLDSPLILLRRDLDTSFKGREISIESPNDMSAALREAPNFGLVRQIGSLELFALPTNTSGTESVAHFATVNTSTPDLRSLSFFPQYTPLVSTEPITGIPNVVQAPPLEQWTATGDRFEWKPRAPRGWEYRLGDLETHEVLRLDHSGTYKSHAGTQATYSSDVDDGITVSLSGRSVIGNGDFSLGPWGPVGNCHAVFDPRQHPVLGATVSAQGGPDGLAALDLSATGDSACESQLLTWQHGPIVITLKVRPVRGAAPRLCLWEFGPNRCAAVPSLQSTRGWSFYRAAVTPDEGTTSIRLYLYADAGGSDASTVVQYADVHVVEVPALPILALVAEPQAGDGSTVQLFVLHESFSQYWHASLGRHVLVDGMLNGWIASKGSSDIRIEYQHETAVRLASVVSAVTVLSILTLALIPVVIRLRRRWPLQR